MKLGFIGIGKIASAVVEGLCSSEMSDLEIFLSPRNEERSKALAQRFKQVQRQASNQEVLDHSEVVIIAVRPGDAPAVLGELKFREEQTVVSLIALLKYTDLQTLVRPAETVCRAIPLPTVVQHNCPIPLFKANKTVRRLFAQLGTPLDVENEDQLHVIWTLSGLISPFYHLMGRLADWTKQHGVDPTIANVYTVDMFESLAFAARHARPIDFAGLADHAATPGGMNEQAGREIDEAKAHDAWVKAADRLLERFKKMG